MKYQTLKEGSTSADMKEAASPFYLNMHDFEGLECRSVFRNARKGHRVDRHFSQNECLEWCGNQGLEETKGSDQDRTSDVHKTATRIEAEC